MYLKLIANHITWVLTAIEFSQIFVYYLSLKLQKFTIALFFLRKYLNEDFYPFFHNFEQILIWLIIDVYKNNWQMGCIFSVCYETCNRLDIFVRFSVLRYFSFKKREIYSIGNIIHFLLAQITPFLHTILHLNFFIVVIGWYI